MTEKIHEGPCDNMTLPRQSLGVIFYQELKNKDPNQIALIDNTYKKEVSYEQILGLSVKLAVQLKKMGVRKGDVISIIAQNNWKYVVTILAGLYIGAKLNLLNHDYTSGELKHFLLISKPAIIFCSSKTIDNIFKLEEESFFPQHVIVYDSETSVKIQNFEDLLEDDSSNIFSPIELNPEEVAFILTSSGTTGFPKCVMLTHANLRITLTYAVDPNFVDLNSEAIGCAFLPFFHIFGLALALGGILSSMKFVILDKFIPDQFLTVIQDYRVSKLFVVPPVLLFLVKTPLVNNYDLSSIEDILCGAAPITKELEDMVNKKFHVKTVRQIFGMTEIAGAATILPKNIKKSGTIGQVVTTFKVKVCDIENGRVLSANQVGQLLVSGQGVMRGYLGNEEESKNAFDEEGFLKTGDLGYYDEEGFFYIVGRLKEIIKYKGFQVSPTELETVLIQHPAVKDAGVIGIPDERAGEVPLAFVVKQPNTNIKEEDIIRYIEENMSIQKRLYGGVKFVDEIPKNPSGKILRRKLKELL